MPGVFVSKLVEYVRIWRLLTFLFLWKPNRALSRVNLQNLALSTAIYGDNYIFMRFSLLFSIFNIHIDRMRSFFRLIGLLLFSFIFTFVLQWWNLLFLLVFELERNNFDEIFSNYTKSIMHKT